MARSKIRAPKIQAPKNQSEFIVSPNHGLGKCLLENQNRFQQFSADNGRLGDLRQTARNECITAAIQHSSIIDPKLTHDADSSLDDANSLLFVSGHQPEFFHPGVWFKNILLNRLTRRYSATSINLIIDNDECRETSISVPTGTLDSPHREKVEFDSPMEPLPFERRPWSDRAVLSQFASDVKATIATLSDHSMIVDELAEFVDELSGDQAERSIGENLGEWIARFRHSIELRHGIRNLEVPLSHLCQGSAFCRFAAMFILDANRFHDSYNRSLLSYRRTNRLRSQTHPVPNLFKTEGWTELPFWLWSDQSPQRGPLFVKQEGSRIQVSDRDQLQFAIDADQVEQELANLNNQGVAIRPRALMTTMYARMFLADLFIHGIGGAKYDELTDAIIEDYFNVQPPTFLTATSTHYLPLGTEFFDESHVRDSNNELRSRRFAPEKFLSQKQLSDQESPASFLVNEKRKLLEDIPDRGQKSRWHQAIESVNQKLIELSREEFSHLRSQLQKMEQKRRSNELLMSREYSFLLHPPTLPDELIRMADQAIEEID